MFTFLQISSFGWKENTNHNPHNTSIFDDGGKIINKSFALYHKTFEVTSANQSIVMTFPKHQQPTLATSSFCLAAKIAFKRRHLLSDHLIQAASPKDSWSYLPLQTPTHSQGAGSFHKIQKSEKRSSDTRISRNCIFKIHLS